MAFIPKYILILFFLIIFDYIAGILIEKAEGRRRKVYLGCSLVVNVGMLAFFKYFNFVSANLAQLAAWLHWNITPSTLALVLPIGLSFHTFQSMSYTIEIYYNKQRAERHLGIYTLYVLFYPQLVAGPIERPQNLIHQFHERKNVNYRRIIDGLTLMLVGFLKKVVVADNLAPVVNQVYHDPQSYSSWALIIATYFFAFQVYCDFSGYTDIARGAARVMGFELMENFKFPFSAKSISEFWQRWHISLTTWFRDYIYTPLVRHSMDNEKATPFRLHLFILFVFLISGFWHGAAWTFGIWGILHGGLLIGAGLLKPLRKRVYVGLKMRNHPRLLNAWRVFATFHLLWFTWILFRAKSMGDAWYIFTHLFVGLGYSSFDELRLGIDFSTFLFLIGLITSLELFQWAQRNQIFLQSFKSRPRWIRWGIGYLALATLLYLGQVKPQQFIYFQF